MGEDFGRGLRALVLDDEPVIVVIVGELLQDCGFAVEAASSCAEALGRHAAAPFDLYLLDKNLPDGSGLDFARQLQSEGLDAEVVIMSGFANLSSAVEAVQCQVADYVIKPFTVDDLRARVHRVVASLSLKRAHTRLLEELRHKTSILETLATRDTVTTLCNHSHFHDSVERELQRSQAGDQPFCVALIDLDGFARVNDTYGHVRGNEVLRAFGVLLGARTRSLGPDTVPRRGPQDLVARYAGDRFALLLPQTSRGGAAATCERLRQALGRHDFGLPGGPPLSMSTGLAGFPTDGADRGALLAAAAIALQAAKSSGGNRVLCFSPDLARQGKLEEAAAAREITRQQALLRTISQSLVRFVYQPIVDLRQGTVVAYEALCRPLEGTFASPEELFTAAEKAGQGPALGRVGRAVAVRPMAALPAPQLLFLNLQPQEFMEPGYLEEELVLQPWAGRLVFEITEGAQIHDFAHARARIRELRGLGFRIAIDDLGSGYSSLNSLALLEPDYVKLDMAMIRGLSSLSRQGRLIKHILEFCAEEELLVIAEGVETEAELRAVSDLGVALVQGNYFARPAAAPPFASVAARPLAGSAPVEPP